MLAGGARAFSSARAYFINLFCYQTTRTIFAWHCTTAPRGSSTTYKHNQNLCKLLNYWTNLILYISSNKLVLSRYERTRACEQDSLHAFKRVLYPILKSNQRIDVFTKLYLRHKRPEQSHQCFLITIEQVCFSRVQRVCIS
jgi:hypothetical protein